MKKLVKESLYEYNNGPINYNDDWDEGIDGEEYWEKVAVAMNGSLESFELDHHREKRHIVILLDDGMEVDILHDWRKDGTETKPWTYINGDDSYGRIAIWEDNPESYAEDILECI